MVQRASEGKQYGDTNKSHVLAIKRVINFWNKFRHSSYKDWMIDESWVEQYTEKFCQENPDRNRVFKGHTPDLVLFEWHEDYPVVKLVIEVDGESHDSKTRQISDGIFKKWIQKRYGDVPLIRLQKRELELDIVLAHEYLWQELKEWTQQ